MSSPAGNGWFAAGDTDGREALRICILSAGHRQMFIVRVGADHP